ncbi:MAG: type II secretion system secretin GspD, partial [Myxococcota bacterium]|nr:type II secretion system secretin GspD [Myxococcota bacterium]
MTTAYAQDVDTESEMVQLDFQNAEITDVIDTIAKLTKTNFIYDDRVRGRVTIISPTPVPAEQAYAVFESVLQVKGFTTVKTPGGALKVIPLREAKETSVETSRSTAAPRNRDTFITRLIPLRYIEAESIVNTLKPLVSKDAAIAAYGPTNTVILTESASNIRRIIAILEKIDIETYREEIAVIRIEFADAGIMASQIAEIFGATVSASSGRAGRAGRTARRGGNTPTPAAAARAGGDLGKVRIITDERTNALIVLAPKTQLEEVRRLVNKLDVPVTGGGRIHVYYLQHADSEELAQTLTSMISGGSGARSSTGNTAQGGAAQAIRGQVAGLSAGLSVTADPATNSLVIQASQEGFNTISAVIAKLDVQRPQVLVEALIMEVLAQEGEELGFNGLVKIVQGDNEYIVALASDVATNTLLGGIPSAANIAGIQNPLIGSLVNGDPQPVASGGSKTAIQGIIRAAAKDDSNNIISAPHILTSDNEEAEIRVGDKIPIVSSRVDAAVGAPQLSTSVNVERQDIGVTLRVTPQITEGDTLRLDIFQEITAVNNT